MGFQTDNIVPSGGMNSDLDLSLIPRGDYISGLNIQHITDAGGSSYAIQNTKGNLLRFAIPSTSVQNKIYRVTLGTDNATSHTLNFYKTNGSLLGTCSYTEGANIGASRANIITAINGVAAVLAQSPSYAAYGTTDELITLTLVTGYEWTLTSDDLTNPTVTQEAWNTSLTGQANVIGSYDLLGDLFIWSTPRTTLPTVFGSIISTADNGSGLIRVLVADATGLTTGQSVTISGAITDTNGSWIITVIDGTHFDLKNSVYSGTTTGSITINVQGIGEIGVAVYDPNTDVTTYTTLIKSKEFNFTTKHQIDTYCEKNNFQRSLYWTDDYNVPRVFYYSGVYVSNGGIAVINSDGNYAYGSIADETKLILTNSSLGFTFNKQYASGGGVLSGNWRYAVRLLTATFSSTNWTELSNPINVYKANPASPSSIGGDDALTVTGKINEFIVSNLVSGLFSYVELAGVNYVDGAIVGSIINRFLIDNTTMTIQHTGVENNTTNLDVATLNQFSFDIETAKSIDAIDNRLILTNLTTAQEVDLSSFAQTFTHSVKRDTINNIGLGGTGNKLGEYQDPINVFSKVGYMINDIYRFGARFRMKSTGNLTKVFWVNDICISTTAGSPVPIPASDTARRVAGLVDWNLTATGANPLVYVPYVEFSGIVKSFIVDGVPVSDLISEIHFERAERVKEILTTGAIANTYEVGMDFGGGAITANTEYSGISGFDGVHTAYPGAGVAISDIVKLYSPDVLCGSASLTLGGSDKIISMGGGGVMQHLVEPTGETYQSDLSEYNAFYSGNSPYVRTISTLSFLGDGVGPITVNGASYYNKFDNNLGDSDIRRSGYVIYCSGASFGAISGTDYGIYSAQYYRAITYTDSDNNKYGNRISTRYIPTGAILTIDSSTSNPATQSVFGGDVFTQKTYLKHRAGVPITVGGGGGIAFYSQNVVNSQMIKKYGNSDAAWDYPNVATDLWLRTASLGEATAPYNKGYTIVNGISSDIAFDPNLPSQNDLPTEIRWSDLKPQNAVVDNFRVFLPLNFKDLPLSWGEITHHENFNGELFTFQPRMLQRQYFNTRGTMNVGGQTPTQVLIGDGSVMSRDGQMVTGIGTYHKWSVIKGKSAQGNDTLYWINTELKKAMRMGYDGTISIADIHGMQSFFANNLKWVVGKDTPADGQGICGVWDDRYMAAIWTVMGIREESTWSESSSYEEGDAVAYIPEEFSTFNETGELYRALENIPASAVGSNPAPIVWGVSNGPTGQAYIIDFTNNVTIGFALWNTDLDTTMADLVTSLNTNTNPDPGNPIWGSIPAFDNSLGYTCSWDIGAQEFTVNTPPAVYATYNNTELFFAYQGGAGLVLSPSQSQLFSGGIDPVINNPPPESESWELIPHTDNNYYNEYTIEFNEQKNKFTTFYSFLPKIYLKWTDTFLTPRPISDTGEVYEHRLGDYCVWYNNGDTYQVENGNIELIYNQQINASKIYNALWLYSLLVPARMDLYTNRHQSFLLAADAENQLDYYTLPVKNDILTSSNGQLNDEDTSGLFGEYLKVKITFTAGVFQKIVDLVVKFWSQSRSSSK